MEKGIIRPPIVTVLGHVDHGKTTLLDAIRKTSVAAREAGGITQSIGASAVTTKDNKKITFIDTPGHAAFSEMRSRGAKVADIAVLVVDASDGVKPQTAEALGFIKEAEIPFIVAATKMDLPSASADAVLGQLEKGGVAFEGRGGSTPWIGVSAKNGQGIEELLELISLLAEVNEIKGNPAANLEAVVIETSKGKAGPIASVVVREGTLKVGQEVFAGSLSAKTRGLFNAQGKSTKEVLPGEAAAILGFAQLPPVGSIVQSIKSDNFQERGWAKAGGPVRVTTEQIPVLIKASSAGGLEAVLAGLPKEIVVIDSGVGDVFESDVLDAKASGVDFIFAFECGASPSVLKLAEAEGIKIESFRIIYELFERLAELIKGGKVEILGKAEIIASFPFDGKKIAGCRVIEGKITKSDTLVLIRKEKEIGKCRPVSLKKQKTEISEAKAGEEFGILFEPQLDFANGDMIVSVRD